VAVLKKYNLDGKEIGQAVVEDALVQTTANGQMIKDYLVALRANARQWSAHTKTRAEVSHSGKKPHPQKGTGRARQGYLGSPQYKGGGRVHAPRAKFDQHVRVNKKERQAAVRHLLAEKILASRCHVLQCGQLETPKTRTVADFLRALQLSGKRVLFLAEGVVNAKAAASLGPANKYATLVRSMRNLQAVEFALVPNVSGYDVTLSHDIVLLEDALDDLMVLLGGGK
jgi:large subunit ribosomal protein L4